MKKIFTSILLAAVSVMTVYGQQLANNGFESTWTDMSCWYANKYKTKGTAPAPWKISNVADPSVAACVVGEKAAGYNSASAVKVFVKSMVGKAVPGYLTLGQPWSTAQGMTGGNPDGGTFGGIDFTYRPDALAFYYKSTGSGQPTVVAYGWKGTWTQASVPSNIVVFGSATKVTMTDRDRNIIGETTSQGGAVTKTDDAELIYKIRTRLEAATSDWTYAELPFEYLSTANPAKFNVIFAAEDYFNSSPGTGNELTVDDVMLVYYSRLSSLSVNGVAVEGFDSKTFTYDLSTQELPEASAITYTLLSNSGASSATVTVDAENAQVKVTVANQTGCNDWDNASSHTYVLQFKKVEPEPEPEPVELAPNYTGTAKMEYYGSVSDVNVTLAINADESGAEKTGYATLVVNGMGTDILKGCVEYVAEGTTLTLKGMTVGNGYGGTTTVDIVFTIAEDGTLLGAPTEYYGTTMATAAIMVNFDGSVLTPEAGGVEPEPEPEPEPGEGVATVYPGTVTILQNDYLGTEEDLNLPGEVTITQYENNTCDFLLPDFALGDTPDAVIGDIEVKGVSTSEENGVVTYNGVTKGMVLSFAGMEVVANVTVTGTTENGVAKMDINVIWLTDPENDPEGYEGIPIFVKFNGNSQATAIDKVEINNANYPVEYFNLQGMPVNEGNLKSGIYIRRQGTDVKKIYVK